MTQATASQIAQPSIFTDVCDLDQTLEVCRDALAKTRLPAAVASIIKYFDGRRPTKEVLAQTQISEAKAEAVVRKLTDLGVLRSVSSPHCTANSAPHRGAETTGFSAAEEAFFAAELEPIDACDLPFESPKEKVQSALRRVRQALRR